MGSERGYGHPENDREFHLSVPLPPQHRSQILSQKVAAFPSNGSEFLPIHWNNSCSFWTVAPHGFFPQIRQQNSSLIHPNKSLPLGCFKNALNHVNHHLNHKSLYGDIGKFKFLGHNFPPGPAHHHHRGTEGHNRESYRVAALPPRFEYKIKNNGIREARYVSKDIDHNVDKAKYNFHDFDKDKILKNQRDSHDLTAGSSLHFVSASDIKELGLEDDSDKKSDNKRHGRDKDYKSDNRGLWIMNQRMRNLKRQTACRSDIYRLNAPFLAVFESLIPTDQVEQKQLLTVLEKLVNKEWPKARLHLFGSRASSFGFSKSDLDVCFAVEHENIDKCEVLLKLADMLPSENFENVQAITHARVPIVKFMDPVTGISCDICINNVLAVVNTKLLRDYAQIDVRLQQLAFIVKYWAKSRRVNETYQGTLSSYAYVLMCIHFLQQRRPAILPCLQTMETTYSATVENVECAYFDQVEKLKNFGAQNRESIAQLVWAFFHYWAYCHDYANGVISVRTGSTLSKTAKDWKRRVGKDCHLICIEDPFVACNDLGRAVDKYSVRILREEFERAAKIMHNDPNPYATLFEPYVPN